MLILPSRGRVAPQDYKALTLREGHHPEGEARKAQPQEGLEQQTGALAVNPRGPVWSQRGRLILEVLPPGRVLQVERRAGRAVLRTTRLWAEAQAVALP